MKITKSQLKQIIKEELEEALRTAGPEETSLTWDPSQGKTTRPGKSSARKQRWHAAFDALPDQAKKWHKEVRGLHPPQREEALQKIATTSANTTESIEAFKALEAFYEQYGAQGDRIG
tara:strand:+ start:1086 stop:1439 length:354 start_codon:yes stop_codon:yes gene_type:complete